MMQMLLFMISFSLLSLWLIEKRQHKSVLYKCRNIGNANNFGNTDNDMKKSAFVEIMADSTEKTTGILKTMRSLFCTICMSTLILGLSLGLGGFVDFAKANNPSSIDPSIKSGQYSQKGASGVWRLRIFDSAIVTGDTVLLGEIAEPLGDISAGEWQKLAKKTLWPSPTNVGRPFQINKQRLLGALRQYIGMYADSCILPNSLAIQKGGAIIRDADLRRMVIQRLAPQINALGGHSDLTDYRLPAYIFLSHASQNLILEPTEVKPGRVNVRFGIQELDGSIVRRFSGSVFLNLWVDAPALIRPMAKGDAVRPTDITYKSVNLAYENGELWDGRGGPWQLLRAVGALQPIAASDLQALAVVHKGTKVQLVYEKGNVRLSIVGEAMEDGGLGDLIMIKNLDTKKQIYGMVKDQNTVIAR